MQSVKKRIISLCMSAAIASSALTGLTVMSNADDLDSPSDIPTTRPPATTMQGDIQNRDETTTHREKIIMGDEHAESDYEYNVNDDGMASIERYTGADVETLVIPSSIDGHKITRIGGYTFCSLSALHSVTVSEGIKEIGSHAFSECPELKSVTFPNSIESINSNAFDECPALEEINLPEKEIEIEHDAFDGTAYYNNPKNWDNGILYVGKIHFIKADPDKVSGDVTLRAGVYRIPNEEFKNCANLTGITIPDSVKRIGGEAFMDCASLKKVKLSKNLTKLFDSTFSGCSSLESIEIPDSVTDLGNQVFTDCTSLKSVKLPDTLTSIGHLCFRGCTAVKSIDIPSSVTFIGDGCFEGCTAVKSIDIPSSVTFIRDECFEGCTALESIAIPDGVTKLSYGVFKNCTSLAEISLPEKIEFIGPDLVNNTAYANNADNWTDGLLYLDNYLIKADTDALSGKVTVKNGTTLIASSAFSACSSLESIIIPSGVSYLGYNAFEDCTSLSEVTINASLAMDDSDDLFEYLFAGCTELKAINVNPDNETLSSEDGVLFNKDRTKLIIYPANRDADSYIIPDSVKEICGIAFYGAKNLKSISMSDNVTEIRYSAFSDCENLQKIKLSDNITAISENAFRYCPDLTDIELGNNITYIADSAFADTGLMNDESNWENGVIYLGKYLIKANSSSIASEYTVKDGTRLIAAKAFEECENLTSIT
ncbi:MAG: leucine-rich repeat domain-containing protein, partial [Oscillospiraceae bacterium]|nr:leucine-rich repeat domain-containing protein [Oscillospiraceae bacterium]